MTTDLRALLTAHRIIAVNGPLIACACDPDTWLPGHAVYADHLEAEVTPPRDDTTTPVVPNVALTAAVVAYAAARDTHGHPFTHAERLRAALLAAAPHITTANPDHDAYQRGRTTGLREAADLIQATP